MKNENEKKLEKFFDKTSEEIKSDYRADQNANHYGRAQGSQNKNSSCKVLVNKYRPNGLDKKY